MEQFSKKWEKNHRDISGFDMSEIEIRENNGSMKK